MIPDKQKIQEILSETIVALCNNGLSYDCELEVEGLLGITLDKKDVLLVKISQVVQGSKDAVLKENQNSDSGLSPNVSVENYAPSSAAKRNLTTPIKSNRSPKRQRPDLDSTEPQVKLSPSGSSHMLELRDGSPLETKRESSKGSFSNSSSPLPRVLANESDTARGSTWKADNLASTDVVMSQNTTSPNSQQLFVLRKKSPHSHVNKLSPSSDNTSYNVLNVAPSYAAKVDFGFKRETKRVLTRAEEKFLVDWVFEKSASAEGITLQRVLKEVKNWLDAENKDSSYPHNLPNEEWFREFLRRHPELYAIKWWD